VTQEDNAPLDEWPTADPDGGEAVRASELRFEREFGPAPYGMVVTRLAAERPSAYIAVNGTFCRLTGYSRSEGEHHECPFLDHRPGRRDRIYGHGQGHHRHGD